MGYTDDFIAAFTTHIHFSDSSAALDYMFRTAEKIFGSLEQIRNISPGDKVT